MASEKFFVFNESGTLKRLKGRIVRFLDNEDPVNADKVNIRASISVPAAAEGLTPANNLSDVSSAATSRDNLGVPSDDELARSTSIKITGQTLHFNGSSSFFDASGNSIFSFTNSTDDTEFSISANFNPSDLSADDRTIMAKYGGSAAVREWRLYLISTGRAYFEVRDTSGNTRVTYSTAVFTTDEWQNIVVTAAGSGPNSAAAFTATAFKIYRNGIDVTDASTGSGEYTGMSDTYQPVYIGAIAGPADVFKGQIKDVVIFNKELSTAEVLTVKDGQLGFPDEYGNTVGSAYSSNFTSDSTHSWVAATGALSATETHGSDSDNLVYTVDNTSGSNHRLYRTLSVTAGKRYRITYEYFMPSGNDVVDGFVVQSGAGNTSDTVTTAVTDAWTFRSFEDTWDGADLQLRIYVTDGGSLTVNDPGGDDKIAIRNVKVTPIGTIADFRAEDYNESAGKLLDRTSNNLVGVANSVSVVGSRRHLSVDTIDIKNLPTSSAGLSAGEVWSNSGVLTVV